jgi:hypothetical protein
MPEWTSLPRPIRRDPHLDADEKVLAEARTWFIGEEQAREAPWCTPAPPRRGKPFLAPLRVSERHLRGPLGALRGWRVGILVQLVDTPRPWRPPRSDAPYIIRPVFRPLAASRPTSPNRVGPTAPPRSNW